MSVNLVSVTPDAEYNIIYIARVSSDQSKTDTGLLSYLIRNGHWSPFEHAYMTLEIETSRAISAQICRHRSFTFQEFSQRYAEVTEYEDSIARTKGATNRQSSLETSDKNLAHWWEDVYIRQCDSAFDIYSQAIERGIAPEVARFVLPISASTRLYMTGSVRSWIHYLGDGPGGRTNEHTQFEHREIALAGKEIFCKEFPVISKALGWNVEPRTTFYDLGEKEMPHPDTLT